MDAVFCIDCEIQYCYEQDHWHGDFVVARHLEVQSKACYVTSTSKSHRECVVEVKMEPGFVVQMYSGWVAKNKFRYGTMILTTMNH